MAAADLAPIWGHTCGRCADLGVHPRRPETHRDLRACTSELHRSREALSRARGRAPIWGRPRRSAETAPVWGHTCWNPPIWGLAPIWGHSSESAPIWAKSHIMFIRGNRADRTSHAVVATACVLLPVSWSVAERWCGRIGTHRGALAHHPAD